MKKVKLLFSTMLIIITCTGCTMEYNLNITKDTVEEVISVNDYITATRTKEDILDDYNTWYPTFVNYIVEGETIEIEDYSYKTDGVEYHQKEITEINNGYNYLYKYTYNIDEYYDSYALTTAFIETTIQKNTNTLVLKTSKENLLCQYGDFDSLKVNITIDPEIYELNYTNSSNVNNNTYSWVLDRSNCEDSQIILTLDADYTGTQNDAPNTDNVEENTDYAIYIFVGVLILIVLIVSLIFKILRDKNKKINLDD